MRGLHYNTSIALAALLVAVGGCSQKQENSDMNEVELEGPRAAKKPKELTIHGDTRIDEYYWLNERENPEVIAYLEAENAYTDEKLKATEAMQSKLFDEIVGRIKQTDESVPYFDNGYYYYTRYEEGKEYPIYCRKPGSLDAEEQIMLNANTMAEGSEFFQIGGVSVSPNNKWVAYGVDMVGRRIYTLHFKNLETGEIVADQIDRCTGGAAWASDNKTVFYSVQDDALRSHKIFRYEIGSGTNSGTEVFHETDDTYGTGVYRTKSGKYLMIGSWSTLSTEYRMLDANNPTGEFTIIQPRQRELEYHPTHFGDHFYIRTNHEAKNFRLMKAPVAAPGIDNWEVVVEHRSDVLLEDLEIFKNFLVLDERKNGLTQVRIMPWDGGEEHYLDFGEATYTAYLSTNREFDSEVLRFGYSSLTTPNSTFDYNMADRSKTLMKQQEVVGDFDPGNYEAERLYAKARDGVSVPISLVYRKGLKKDGSNPCLLYAYGSYGSSTDAYFNSSRLSLLDRGFVFAIAHIRGGEEMGRHWYEDGKLLKKKNTFNDFIDCAEHLVANQYTNSDKLFAIGGSAGGLLMGAIVNMRPDLWKGVVAAVPFVDVVTTMLDESIPLTTGEFDEWGNPKDEEYYHYIKSYSPYDNVTAQDYPAMLVTTGLHDSQVQYWEPAKWVARLRDVKTDNNLLLLHTNMDAGHGGASGRFKRHKETAMEYAFMLHLLGIKE